MPPLPPRYSPELRSLMGAILQQNPAARPTIDDILQTSAVRGTSLHEQLFWLSCL